MGYYLGISKSVDKKFSKLAKKDRRQFEAINKKIQQILDNPSHFKPLKGDMHGARRAHIGPFVIVYEVDDERKIVRLLDYDHHDKVY